MTAGDESELSKYTPGPNAVDITPDKDGGVFKEVIKEGEGEEYPSAGCTVKTLYHGTLIDGTVFDSTRESGKPFEFTLGRESVIKGWELGIATMKKGEVALLICKPEYAYGKNGSQKIPPNATLVFEITLVSWVNEDISENKDRGIIRVVINKGSGYSTPNDGALVKVHLTGKYNGKVFEDRDVSFNIGEGSEYGVIKGVETALLNFTKGEKSNLKIKPKYAFGEEGHEEFGIPPNATVTYDVELKNFEKAKESWDLSAPEKISQANMLKEKATNYFKAGKYAVAIKLYQNATQYIDSGTGFSAEENSERKALLLAITLNLGLAYLKLGENREAKKECDKALEMDPNNVKALFRRGQAYLNLNEPENAKLDFESVVKLEATNKLAANQILVCCQKLKQQREREKKIYANMFEKFAKKDKEKEESVMKDPGVMKLGEWGKEERDREPTDFEQENPDILLLNKNDEFKNM